MTDRLTAIRAALAEEGLDALLISCPVDDVFGKHSQNRQYVSGFTGSAGLVLVTRDRALLALDFRYVEQGEIEAEPLGFEIFKAAGPQREWLPALIREAELPGRKIGVSGADVSYEAFLALQRAVDAMPWAQRPALGLASPIVEKLRRVKDAEERAFIQKAVDIADAAFERVEAALEPGQTERELAAAVERAVRDGGADSLSFDTIVAGGAWGAMPHATPRAQPVTAGQPIVIDMGAQYRGYCSDLTRTTVIGARDARFREIYDIVFEAQQNAIEHVEPGMTGKDAHQLAMSVIADAGYGEQFGHGLGHGVGLQVHEAPYLGPSSEDTLEEGMVFTIEPGIYIPGWGGVRIEDIVVLAGGKAQVLSHARKFVPQENSA
ncbi:MAG: aminopeptidase P family protein [Chloroflexi bacterium]|nr:aminopeptidase P family protein [Chloroflexota bacterium]